MAKPMARIKLCPTFILSPGVCERTPGVRRYARSMSIFRVTVGFVGSAERVSGIGRCAGVAPSATDALPGKPYRRIGQWRVRTCAGVIRVDHVDHHHAAVGSGLDAMRDPGGEDDQAA